MYFEILGIAVQETDITAALQGDKGAQVFKGGGGILGTLHKLLGFWFVFLLSDQLWQS